MKKAILSILGGAALLAAQTNAAPVNVTGAGSTFDYPAFTKWFEAFKTVDSGVQFNYQSIGSGGGIKNLTSQTVDFGASDAPMTDAAMAARAECVMLNKGPNILAGISALDRILRRMGENQAKKTPTLRALQTWQN